MPTIFLVIASIFITIPKLIKINKIECNSQYGPCSQSLSGDLSKITGENLAGISKFLKNYFKDNPEVTDYSYQYKIPDKLLVNVLEDKPKYSLKDSGKDSFFLIDSSGVAVGIESSSNLPFVEVDNFMINIGDKVTDDKLFALQIINDMFSQYQIKSGKIVENSLEVNLASGVKVIFPLEGNRLALMGALKLINDRLNSNLGDSKIELAGVKTIDLRFKNPILK